MSRKFYIPITRSGSSILASIFTQLLQERIKRNSRPGDYPYFCIWLILFYWVIGSILLIVLGGIISRIFGWD